jgi:hypothetical protein
MPIWGPVWAPIDSKRDNPITSGWEAQYRARGASSLGACDLYHLLI